MGFGMDWAWALKGARSSGEHMQNAAGGQLGAGDNFIKHGHYVHRAVKGNEVVLGPFASGNVSTRHSLLPGLAPWHPCCLFSQRSKALSGLLRGLYFSPLKLVLPDEC